MLMVLKSVNNKDRYLFTFNEKVNIPLQNLKFITISRGEKRHILYNNIQKQKLGSETLTSESIHSPHKPDVIQQEHYWLKGDPCFQMECSVFGLWSSTMQPPFLRRNLVQPLPSLPPPLLQRRSPHPHDSEQGVDVVASNGIPTCTDDLVLWLSHWKEKHQVRAFQKVSKGKLEIKSQF